jgi:methionine sulfoxide reductase heme-binding subunit
MRHSSAIPSKSGSSYWQRRTVTHITLALTAFAVTAIFWRLFSVRRDFISHISIATAYPALFLTAVAVFLGPWNVLRCRPNPVSFDLRRDIGIWAGIMALLHTGVGLNVHLRGRMWLYFVDEHHRMRHDWFGFGNDTGVVAALLFVLLLAISNDLSIRGLGTRRWKSLQRWTYAAVLLTILHAIAYQHVEERRRAYEVLLGTITVAIVAFQLIGRKKSKATARRHLA